MYLTNTVLSLGKTLVTFFLPNSSDIHHNLHEQYEIHQNAYPHAHVFLQTSSTLQSIPTNQPQHIHFKKPTQLPSLSLTLLSSTTSHSSSFTITHTPPTPSRFQDHNNLYFLPSIPASKNPVLSISPPTNNAH